MKWLSEQYVSSLHMPYKKLREYRKTIVPGIDEQRQADLVKMKEFSKHNDDYNYLLCVIDCYSTNTARHAVPRRLQGFLICTCILVHVSTFPISWFADWPLCGIIYMCKGIKHFFGCLPSCYNTEVSNKPIIVSMLTTMICKGIALYF